MIMGSVEGSRCEDYMDGLLGMSLFLQVSFHKAHA